MIFKYVQALCVCYRFIIFLRLCSLLFLCMNALHYAWNFVRMYDWMDSKVFNSSYRRLNEFRELQIRNFLYKKMLSLDRCHAYVCRIPHWISHRAPIDGLFPARDSPVQLACLCSRFEWGRLSLLEIPRGHKCHRRGLSTPWIVRQWQPKVVLSIRRTGKDIFLISRRQNVKMVLSRSKNI